MSGKSAARTPWRPEHELWLRQNAPGICAEHGLRSWGTKAVWEAFRTAFPEAPVRKSAFHKWADFIRDGGSAQPPPSPVDSLEDLVVHLAWRTFLVVADLQIPYHDAELITRSLEIAKAWQVDGVILNGDIFDFAAISRFDPNVFGDRVSVGEELLLGRQVIESYLRVAPGLLIPGNHEWRLLRHLMQAQLDPTQARDLLANVGERLQFTQLSWALCTAYPGHPIRITHPRSASVIPGAVGADIAIAHQAHVIVAHDHLVCQRRDRSGRWTVTHSGMMADPSRLGYTFTADNRRPLSNQGFVLVHPSTDGTRPLFRLLDPRNTDWELEFQIAGLARRRQP